jgi:hypothetical protein
VRRWRSLLPAQKETAEQAKGMARRVQHNGIWLALAAGFGAALISSRSGLPEKKMARM